VPPREPRFRSWCLPWIATTLGAVVVFLLLVLMYPRALVTPDLSPPPVELWTEKLGGIPWGQGSFATLARREPDLEAAPWAPARLPHASGLPVVSVVPEGSPVAMAWYRTRYVVPAEHRGDKPISIYVGRIWGGAYSVWLNGKLVSANLDDWRMQWNFPLYVQLPLQAAKGGESLEIVIAVPYREVEGYGVGTLFVGPDSQLKPIYERRNLIQVVLPQAGLVVVLVIGLLSLHVWFTRRSETSYLVFAVSALAWFIFDIQYVYDISADTTAAKWLATAVDSALGWAFAGLYIFVLRIEERREVMAERLLIGYAAFVSLITMPVWNWQVNAFLLQHYCDVAILVGVACRITYFGVLSGRTETRALAIASWGLIVIGIHDLIYVAGQRDPDGVNLATYGAFIVFLAHLFAMQRRYVHALTSFEQLNQSLTQRLDAREAELKENYRRLGEVEQQRALFLERERLMQDMHDGIGAKLLTSLSMAERGQFPAEGLTFVLKECIDDLRLVIDSLEPIDRDISTLLATLRQRLGPRLEAAGIHVRWSMGELPELPWLDPPMALHVLRIVQETLANVLKHARANEVAISAQTDEGSRSVIVRVADNGIGFTPRPDRLGRGLKNMKHRARQLGGSVSITRDGHQGTRMELRLPVER
jgi:signal transduction histidine kinase